jgi:hypothetical protein
MLFFSQTIIVKRIVCLLLALLLVACATPAIKPETLGDRAQARWDALLAKDFAKAYTYSTPGYQSSASAVDFEIEFKSRKVIYTSAQYIDHKCENDACTVQMDIGYTLVGALRGVPEWKSKTVVEEKWVKIDEQWRFFQKR